MPDEESDEVCPNCGRKLVYKNGRFGRFLACPGYPECSFTMPIVVEMPGKCPACGGRLLKRTSRKGFAYYACERGHDCPGHGEGEGGENIQGFMTWDVPTKDYCPECGKTMFKRAGKQAIQYGGALQVLFGIKGARWDNYPPYSKYYLSLIHI